MAFVRERFNPHPMGTDTTLMITGIYIGGFLAKTTGAITITGQDPNGVPGYVLVDEIPVLEGVYIPIPLINPGGVGNGGLKVELSGGASGTLFA